MNDIFRAVNSVKRLGDPISHIELARDKFYDIFTKKGVLPFYCNNPYDILNEQSKLKLGIAYSKNEYMGQFLGIPLMIGEKSRVIPKFPQIRYRVNPQTPCYSLGEYSPTMDSYPELISVRQVEDPYANAVGINFLHPIIYKIKNNLTIIIKSRAPSYGNVSDQERVALDTLREQVSEQEFRKYIKYGFILVKGKSKNIYQIFKNMSHTKVWNGGRVIEEICVRIKREISAPATDNVIAFKALIETNEDLFKSLGNLYKYKNIA